MEIDAESQVDGTTLSVELRSTEDALTTLASATTTWQSAGWLQPTLDVAAPVTLSDFEGAESLQVHFVVTHANSGISTTTLAYWEEFAGTDANGTTGAESTGNDDFRIGIVGSTDALTYVYQSAGEYRPYPDAPVPNSSFTITNPNDNDAVREQPTGAITWTTAATGATWAQQYRQSDFGISLCCLRR